MHGPGLYPNGLLETPYMVPLKFFFCEIIALLFATVNHILTIICLFCVQIIFISYCSLLVSNDFKLRINRILKSLLPNNRQNVTDQKFITVTNRVPDNSHINKHHPSVGDFIRCDGDDGLKIETRFFKSEVFMVAI